MFDDVRVKVKSLNIPGMDKLSVNAHQEGKLVCILAGRRHPHSSRPVVVEVGELVGESLDVLGQQP